MTKLLVPRSLCAGRQYREQRKRGIALYPDILLTAVHGLFQQPDEVPLAGAPIAVRPDGTGRTAGDVQ